MTVRSKEYFHDGRDQSPERDDQESSSTWEKKGYVHSQVLRIREEDSHVGQDILDVLKGSGAGAGSNNYGFNLMIRCSDYVYDDDTSRKGADDDQVMKLRRIKVAAASSAVLLTTRPLLPSSPLSRKTATVN